MKDPNEQELISKALRGELSPVEEVRFQQLLGQNVDFAAEWELERALGSTLDQLPDAPISSNFTRLALQAAFREDRQQARPRRWFHFPWLRPAAAGVALAALGFLGFQQYQHSQRRDLAESVTAFSLGAEGVPPTEMFANFEAIQRLSLPAESELDMELLVALQK
jgi:anti-sigma factor RsiW